MSAQENREQDSSLNSFSHTTRRGNPGPDVITAPLPPQQQAFRQAQRGTMFSADCEKG